MQNRCECLDGFFLESLSCHECDKKCRTCNSTSCIKCIDFAENRDDRCECLENREFFNGSCRCAEGFTGTDKCFQCWRFLNAEDVEVYFNDAKFSFEIYFSVEIIALNDFSCNDVLLGEALLSLAPNSSCFWSKEDDGLIVMIDTFTNFTGKVLELNPFRFFSLEKQCLTSPPKLLIQLDADSAQNDSILLPRYALSIIGPESVSKTCNTIVSYSAFINFGAKNIKTVSWKSSPEVPKNESGLSVSFDISSVKSKTLIITAIQINRFGDNFTSQVNLNIFDNKVLEVFIKNGKYFNAKRSEGLLVVAIILNDCGVQGSETWNWSLVSRTANDQRLENLYNFSNENTLFFPPFTLEYQRNYSFSVKVVKDEVVGETNFYVYVEPQELVINVNRGSGSISRYLNTVLNASESFDPDGDDLSFTWTLTNYKVPLNTSESSFMILSQNIENDLEIQVTLEVSTKTKRNSIILVLYPTSLNLSLEYQVTSQRLNFPQTFYVTLNSNFDSKLSWKDSSNKTWSKTTLLSINSLLKEETFKFTLSTNSSEFFGFIKISPNQPASCSELILSRTRLKSFEDPLETTAKNCFDQDESDYPLSYSFGTQDSVTYMSLVSNSLLSQHVFYLFPGKFSMILTVCDSLQSCSEIKTKDILVEKSNFSDPDQIFHRLKSNPAESVIVAGKAGKLSSDLTSAMWKELKKGGHDSQDLENLLSAMLVLAKDKSFNFKEFIKLLKSKNLRFTEKSMDLIFAIQDQLIQNGLKISEVSQLNKFLDKALKDGKSSLNIGEKYEKTMKGMKVFKSCYTDTAIGPSFISNLPVSGSGDILNFQFISYSSPSEAYSLLFTVSGKKVKNFESKHAEEDIFFNDLKILLTVQLSNKSRPVCIYSNETGDFENDGCSIVLSNSTHSTLEITHTSFFYLDFLVESESSSASCAKSYSPCYILNFLVIGCPLLAIIFKISRRTKKELEEHVGLKAENHEEEKESCQVACRTVSEEVVSSKNMSMIRFHLYLGVYTNGKFYLSSLKLFVILCALVSNLFFIGLLLMSFEDIQNDDSGSFFTLVPYSCFAFALTLPVQALLHFTFTRRRQVHGYVLAGGFACGLVFVLVTSIHIIIYNYSMCEAWAKLWSVLFSITVLYEFAFHSVVMFVLYAIRGKLKSG